MPKSDLRSFDYQKVADLDCRIWKAYYRHRFIKMFFLTLQLFKTQLKASTFLAGRMAICFMLASIEYRFNENHLKSTRLINNLTKFYGLVSRSALEPFDYKKAAELELRWWNIQRYGEEKKGLLAAGMAGSFAVVYNVEPEKLLTYGRFRSNATMLRRKSMLEQKVRPDWQKINRLLAKSWKSLHQAVQK